jgi:LAGLIDADG DNA endonuclease family protein
MAPVFQCYQHVDGIGILRALRAFFGCGTLVPKGPNSNVITFSVHGLENLSTRVIPHFQEYPLQTYKASDFSKFREIVLRMKAGEHRKQEGWIELARLAFAMNPHGKNRKYTLEQVESGILRGHTPDLAV